MLGIEGGGRLLPSHVQLITKECEKSKGPVTTLSFHFIVSMLDIQRMSNESNEKYLCTACIHDICALEVIRNQDPSVREA